MLRRLFARRPRRNPSVETKAVASRTASIEPLEERQLFVAAPYITSIVTDNRGEVTFNTNRSLNPATVTTLSVMLFAVGPDGIALTNDDIKMPIRPIYTESNRQLRIRTIGLPADTSYTVKLSAKLITAWDGQHLDGEFNGPGVRSGNGNGYGDLLMVSRRDKSASRVARFYTTYGGINVALNPTAAPGTVANFLHYANESAWDGTFFHRSALLGGPDKGIIQGGGFFVDKDNEIQNVHAHDPITNEFGNSNVRGTIAMAKTSDPNSATNQWFFNVGDNSQALDNPSNSGGFTVFGNVADASSLGVIDIIMGLDRVNAGSPFGELPVQDADAVQQRGSLDPAADVVSVRRVAIMNKISAYS
jgi:cyclophilin family peptidyl-prolyl cis-trans isomerase